MKLFPAEANRTRGCIIHLLRHGQIPNYLTDQSLTPEGEQESLAIGRQLAAHIRPGETISFFSGPARRARQTAAFLRDGLREALSKSKLAAIVCEPVVVDDRLQNIQFYLGHLSYDPIFPLLDIARWRLHETPSAQNEACATFQAEFWSAPDPVTYWLTSGSEFAESPEAVAERTRAYLLDHLAGRQGSPRLRRDICITHSANLRAFVRLIFGHDPGPPPHSSMLTISAGRLYYLGQVGAFPPER